MKLELIEKGNNEFVVDVSDVVWRGSVSMDMAVDGAMRLEKMIEQVAESVKQIVKVKMRMELTGKP